MTAIDPHPVLASRREALDHLDLVRDRVGEFLDHPSAEGLTAVTNLAQGFVRFEADEVLTGPQAADLPDERFDALVEGHDALVARLNRLAWARPGTADVQSEVHQLRHDLLSQIDRYHALRLPRGSLINGG